MDRFCRALVVVVCVTWIGGGSEGADVFKEHVRSTPWLKPEAELAGFKVPKGFEVQLFAADPEIAKPMNIAFDGRGRVWITQTVEYPYAVKDGVKGRDAVKILEDTDGDGRADKITTFADGLNIPIGLYPTHDGCIVFSIPNIYRFYDLDGDGKADKKVVLYGQIGRRDTHGMTNGFRRGFDGWLYACHGFSNTSKLKGRDGSVVEMQSGNTYRMRVDGERVEQFTWGQVNPFGMAMDSMGNLYTADCHSKPIYELLRGGYYPSFGKPHDGLGFAPAMIRHTHGSTAISGIARYQDNLWPKEYWGDVFIGNVMTSRVHRDKLKARGSSREAVEMKDFIEASDPWFRPVDVRMGPDGAMYVADFYNRIIGHYEVSLNHPKRDRTSGRIWRIVYKGEDGKARVHGKMDLTKAGVGELVKTLGHANLTRRLLALDQLTDRVGKKCVEAVKAAVMKPVNDFQVVSGLWVLERLGVLERELLGRFAGHGSRMVRTHVMKIYGERGKWEEDDERRVVKGLSDGDAFVRRAAGETLSKRSAPLPSRVKALLGAMGKVEAGDEHLKHVLKISLRNQLRVKRVVEGLGGLGLSDADKKVVAEITLGAGSEETAGFLLDYVGSVKVERGMLVRYVKHIARYVSGNETVRFVKLMRERFGEDDGFAVMMLGAIVEGVERRGGVLGKEVKGWGESLAKRVLSEGRGGKGVAWRNYAHGGARKGGNPWVVQKRRSDDGKDGMYLCSLPRGEQLTGILRSGVFELPGRLSFYVAGHDGFPDKKAGGKNYVRLVLRGGEEVVRVGAPRHDTARRVVWELGKYEGRKGYVEIVDGDTAGAYAWLAVGRFEPGVVGVPEVSPADAERVPLMMLGLVEKMGLGGVKDEVKGLAETRKYSDGLRGAAMKAYGRIGGEDVIGTAVGVLGDARNGLDLKKGAVEVLAREGSGKGAAALVDALVKASGEVQGVIAVGLAARKDGAEKLMKVIESGKASGRLLQDKGLVARMKASGVVRFEARMKKAMVGLVSVDAVMRKLIAERVKGYEGAKVSVANGKKVFGKYCGVCHRVGKVGQLVGPQLDGIGARGSARLIEDILDPNRNVDRAFRMSVVTMKDKRVLVGLFRRREGRLAVYVDLLGKEFSVAAGEIVKREESPYSVMPGGIGAEIPEGDFYDLLGFLEGSR